MRAIRTTCVSLGVTIGAAMTMAPAQAAPCAQFFPFICLFGPEALAMRPAPPVSETWVAVLPEPPAEPPRRKRLAVHKPLKLTPVAEKEPPPIAVTAKLDEAPIAIPPLRFGPARLRDERAGCRRRCRRKRRRRPRLA